MKSYKVTFDRVGRNHEPGSITVLVDGVDAEDDEYKMREQVYDFARPMLMSRDVDVVVDLEAMTGFIACGFHNGGTFKIEAV